MTFRAARTAALLLACAGPALLSGCAMWSSMFGTSERPGSMSVRSDDEANAAALAVRVRIDAPPELRALIEKNLDLTRLPMLSRGDSIGEAEWMRLVDASPAQVRELLQTEGYFAPTVTVTRAPLSGAAASAPAGAARGSAPSEAVLAINPGPRATIARFTFEVQGELQELADGGDARAKALRADLERAWLLPPGASFRNPAWSDAKAQALARLRAAGYATASWSGTAAEVDRDKHTVRLFVVADSGPLFRAGDITVEGLKVHETATVLNLAEFGRGQPLTESLLLDYQERLQKSGLFESVTVTHELDSAQAGAARVQVKLVEQPLQVYTVGVGYSANTGPRASVEHIHRRLFGQPLRSRSYLEVGGQKQTLDVELSTHPGPNRQRNVAGLVIERLESSTDVVSSGRVRLGRAYDGQRLERLYFLEAERGLRTTRASETVAATRTQTLALSGNAHYVMRDLDSIVLPTRGYTLALQAGLGRSRASGDSDAIGGPFSRAYARFTGYMPLGEAWYAQARVEAGQVFRKSRVAAPDSQLWRAGGDDSVRGYGYRDLGPIVDGTVTSGGALLTTSVEVARPFSASLPSLWGAVFIDAGRAATSFNDFKPAVGTGFGLRWRSPVGPLRLDLAYGEELRRWRVHFSIGIAL
ncbi:MAG: BamA/TamA family outer membrane protein [Rubrivivax sp.]|nr:BamA/TamA family outer membrane protein [Rubrivivax sp.]